MTYDDIMIYDDDSRPSPPIADTSMDRIANEAMEEADADIEQAQEAVERQSQNIAAIVSKHLGTLVKDTEIKYIPQSTASSSAVNPNPVVKAKPKRKKAEIHLMMKPRQVFLGQMV
jgi:hypothetical protein